MASYSPAYDHTKPTLRDTLLAALRNIPGTRSFHLHVLISAPTLHGGLFKFATNPPRTYAQDVLVLCSEQIYSSVSASELDVNEAGEQFCPNSSPVVAPRVLIVAIEATLYNIRSTNSCILYVRKVDSTGYSQGPSPTTTLVRAFLKYYAHPKTRPASCLWLHLFASARGQYLFPNSDQHKDKRLLGDVQLCVWWKRILSDISSDLLGEDMIGANPAAGLSSPHSSGSIPMFYSPLPVHVQGYYILPGFSQLEAEHTLKTPPHDSNIPWVYGHPYAQEHGPLPYSAFALRTHLGHLIPYFGDDPKSRLLDEIACATGAKVEPPSHKRAKTTSSDDYAEYKGNSNGKEEEERTQEAFKELGKVTPDEFWERMSFRHECVADTVTGFFTLIVSRPKPVQAPTLLSMPMRSGRSRPRGPTNRRIVKPDAPPGQIPLHVYKRTLTTLTTEVDYSTAEQAVKATETIESTIKQLCESITVSPAPDTPAQQHSINQTDESVIQEGRKPHHLSLFSPSSAVSYTSCSIPWQANMGMGTATSATSLEVYHSHIYGTVHVRNPVPE